ncbi:hypothetical protein ND748_14240 [Frankia sp. AiPs1]|uniref:hypothetical protein n=1 Tax=Frankia sp. AiPs1 TaxID=573493 RepID=UPI002043B29C|nr:hypothetical protein [Frankia sp. AiPs1]MCM3922815.1 hypothetical protein [Frankia sp. AiPs1]
MADAYSTASSAHPILKIEMPEDSDVFRSERMARSLRADLASVPGLILGPGPAGTHPAQAKTQAKGPAVPTDPTLWIFGATALGTLSRMVVDVVKAWCARDRHRSVRLVNGEKSVEVTGRPDAAQERIIEDFLRDTGS